MIFYFSFYLFTIDHSQYHPDSQYHPVQTFYPARPSARSGLPASSAFRHSVRNDFTGFEIAAFIAWKLTVIMAITMAINPANTNIHQLILIR